MLTSPPNICKNLLLILAIISTSLLRTFLPLKKTQIYAYMHSSSSSIMGLFFYTYTLTIISRCNSSSYTYNHPTRKASRLLVTVVLWEDGRAGVKECVCVCVVFIWLDNHCIMLFYVFRHLN